MKYKAILALAWTLLALSACVIEPYGDGRGGHYRDDGHRVWRE